jgi:hypothetical protein
MTLSIVILNVKMIITLAQQISKVKNSISTLNTDHVTDNYLSYEEKRITNREKNVRHKLSQKEKTNLSENKQLFLRINSFHFRWRRTLVTNFL